MPAKLSRHPHLRKLQQFRENFLFLISDGTYPPYRQQRLYQWCQKAELDWNEAEKLDQFLDRQHELAKARPMGMPLDGPQYQRQPIYISLVIISLS